MEFLVHIVAALLILPLIGGLAWAIELLGLFVLGIFFTRSRVLRDRWRRFLWMFSIIQAGGLIALLCVDLFFFESCVRFAVNRIERDSDIRIEFREARGSMLFGRLELEVARIKLGQRMDVQVSIAKIDVSMWSLLWGTPSVESMWIEGVRGYVSHEGGSRKVSRPFRIERLELRDVDLMIQDSRLPMVHIPLRFRPILTISPLRSDELVWDLLCHSKAEMEILGHELLGKEGWTIKRVSADTLTSWMDVPAFPAVADIHLTCPTESNLDLGVLFHASKGWLDRLTPDLEFHTTLSREQIRGTTHISQLWDEVRNSWHMELRK